MRHRLFYFLPDVSSARRARDDLLLHRLDIEHMHFLANDALPADLPEATVFYKSDIVHGAEIGAMLGAGIGLLLGLYLIATGTADLPKSPAVVLFCAIGLAALGAWFASMIAAAVPNTRLAKFAREIDGGRILLIAEVPARRVAEIEGLLAEHAEMQFQGEDEHVPFFP